MLKLAEQCMWSPSERSRLGEGTHSATVHSSLTFKRGLALFQPTPCLLLGVGDSSGRRLPSELTVPCPARSFTSSASWNLVTCVNKVERSSGQLFFRQVACTRAVR